MTGINGANNHSVEDILASIRTSIAEETGPGRHLRAELQVPSQVNGRRDAHLADEALEFELPAIFKPGHNIVAERPKLLGRLSDALKATAAGEQGRARTVIPFEPSAANRIGEAQDFTPRETPATASANGSGAFPQAAGSAPAEGEPRREMTSFMDTRMSRLGEKTRQSYLPPKPVEPVAAPVAQAPMQRQPPTLPEGNMSHHAADAVDDAAAQLLRPMLRQWLQENMPKIVEKALLSEMNGDQPGKPRR